MTLEELVREVSELEEYTRYMPKNCGSAAASACIRRERSSIRKIISWNISVSSPKANTG